MIGLRRGILCALLSIVGLSAARGAVAQPTGSIKQGASIANLPAVQAVQPAEYYVLGAPITLDQALKQPDATKIMGPDCKLTTVSELRKLHAVARKAVEAPKKIMGGTARVSYTPGVSKARESAALLASVNTAAQASRSGPGTARLNPLTRAPGIEAVNQKTSGFVVTPGAHLTISGWELGDAMGQVNLIGNFPPSGAVGMTIVDWKTGGIEVIMPTGISGVLDQTVSLQVITTARRTYTHPGGSFVATRADTTVTTNIPRLLRFQSGPTWGATMDAAGNVQRGDIGASITCKAVGADTLTVIDPGRGFVVTGLNAVWGETDEGDGDGNGDSGSRTFAQGYGFGDWNGASIPVRWGVWRSHSTNQGLAGEASYDQCNSFYQIAVTVTGPAGVAPF